MYEFLNANPVFVDNSVSRMTAGLQRFDCLHEVAAGVEADVRKCIARGQLPMALTAAATSQLLWMGMLGAASVARRLARDEERDVLAHDVIETLLAGLSTVPCQRRESDLESALPEISA